ncbi:8379_t:CDS:2 [Funneliformis mosseae]|uniref:8379_t:CDS:1 n=1 Tax=Funneliformis mosseae TaxID=27381 RepID=A0A9N8VSK9_FUNMO|nr:8379_t:CDS:2 [Funneliformis mosseae]
MTSSLKGIEESPTLQQVSQEDQQVDQRSFDTQPEQQGEEVVLQHSIVALPLPASTSTTTQPTSPSEPQQFSGYLTDNVWYEVFRQLHCDLGEYLYSCLLVNTQFFRNAVPFFWRDVQITYFSQLTSFVRILESKNQTLPYARYIRTIYIAARTPRTPNKTRSAELANLLYKLASIDVNWRLLSFTLDLDWRDCGESTIWTNFFAKFGKHLEHVALHGSSPFLSDALSFSIGEFCPNLKFLTLESRYFNGYGILNIAEKCPLTELSIWCRQVTSSVIFNCDLDDKPLLSLITTPEGYDDDNIPNTSSNENITRTSYSSSSSYKDNSSKISLLPKLKSFYFIQSYAFSPNALTSSGLLRLLSTCPNLTELTLVVSNSSKIVNDISIEKIIKRLPLDSFEIVNPYSNQLPFHHLDHFDVTVEGLKMAIKHKPDLRLRVGAFDSMIS